MYDDDPGYRGDVLYDVWRGGGSVDAVDYDRVDDYRSDGMDSEEAACAELRRQRRRRPN